MLKARQGELDLARRYRSKALTLLPAGESLLPLHRSQAWVDELDGVLSAAEAASPESAHVVIRTVGEFVVEIKGRRIYDRDWKGQRTKLLLMALVAEGCYKIPAVRLADRLWPDSEGDRAMQNLKVALHRLRRLGCAPGETPVNWVHVKHGVVSLVRGLCWVDVHEMEALLDARENWREVIVQHDEGEFLPGDFSHPWVVRYRERIQFMLEKQ